VVECNVSAAVGRAEIRGSSNHTMQKHSIPRSSHLSRFGLLAFAVLVMLNPADAGAAEQKTIKIAVEGAFPPFNYLDSNQQLQGFDVDIAKALCDAGTLTCEFVIQEWTGMIPSLLAGRYDAIISSMSMSEERRQKVHFTKRYYDSPTVFISRKDNPLQSVKPEDLQGVHLGVTAGTSQEAYVKQFYATASVTVFPASPDLYKGLADGAVDLILEDKLAVYDWLTNTKAGSCCMFKGEDIKNPQFFGDGAGIALRPDDPQLLQTLNAALDSIQSDGTYDMINAKYFPFEIR
jgi:polar amino acid transport system substrate-binding protein